MAAARKLLSELRRARRPFFHSGSLQSSTLVNRHCPPVHLPASVPPLFQIPASFDRSRNLWPSLAVASSSRYFSSSPPSELGTPGSSQSIDSEVELELGDAVVLTDGSGTASSLVGTNGGVEYDFPVRAVVNMLDWFHDSTGLPWWVTIASSALILRISLLPFLMFQLHKLKRIAEMLPKLPPPFPPPLSGKSFVNQFSLFRRERKAIGCPSLLWFLAYISVQFPCFILLMATVRRMSMDKYIGFDTGGCLWFQNLTEYSLGAPGLIFPTLIAGLHFINVQVSFRSSKLREETKNSLFDLLARYYRIYLKLLTVPIFVTGFCIPQGSLVYWVTNSSLNIVQQLCLQNPTIRGKLGLPDKEVPKTTSSPENSNPISKVSQAIKNPRMVPVKNLSPKDLVALSVVSLSKGDKDGAIPFLRLALEKDPEYVRALTIMGQTLLQKGEVMESIKYFEQAISKLSVRGTPTEAEDVDLLIQASQWAGTAYIRQGMRTEGRVHLERVASMVEPEDSRGKAHYYEGLVILASALLNEGRKEEAVEYLRKAVAYNPEYNVYLEQCEKEDSDEFVDDLTSSRRRDY